MESSTANLGPLAASKRFARRLLTIGENRLELLVLEVQEERVRLLRAILLALGVGVFAFLTGAALTVAIVVLLWNLSPVAVLLVLASLYAGAAAFLYSRIVLLLHDWKTLPATLEELRKDRVCLEQILG
ncbi:MAG TPA: phage holin family protein [Verrucomicrobiae bacterium]